MTVQTTTRKAQFIGNGVATAFSFAFKVYLAADLSLVTTDAFGNQHALVLNSDYSVSLNADQNGSPGGTVTYPMAGSPLASNMTLTVASAVAQTQGTHLTNGGNFYPSVIEDALDRSTILIQQLQYQLTSALQTPLGDTAASLQLPPVSQRANQFLAFDANGNAIVLAGTGSATDGAQVAVYSGLTAKSAKLYVNTLAELTALPVPAVPAGKTVLVEMAGLSAYGDGGSGTFYWQYNSNQTPVTGMVVQPSSLPTAGRWLRAYSGKVSAQWVGATGNGTTDDSVACNTLHTYCAANLVNAYYPPGLTYKVSTQAWSLDLGKFSVTSEGATIDFTGLPSGTPAIALFSSLAFPELANITHRLSGFTFKGSTSAPSGSHCINYGGNSNVQNNDFLVDRCAFIGFYNQVNFLNNSWRCKMLSCRFEQPTNLSLNYPNGLTNSGELMTMAFCMFADGPGFNLVGGEWHFLSNSFDASSANVVDGYATLHMNGCHIENLAYTPTFLTLQTGIVRITGGNLVHEPAGSVPYTNTFFVNNATDQVSCFDFNGLMIQFVDDSHYLPENVVGYKTIVSGTGLVRGYVNYRQKDFTSHVYPLLTYQRNLLQNGNFGTGDLTGWTTSGSGGSAVVNATGSVPGAAYAVTMSGAYQLTQKGLCTPGSTVMLGMYFVSNTGVNAFPKIVFLAADGVTVIQTVNVTVATGISPFYQTMMALAPAGTAFVQWQFGTTGGQTTVFSNVVLDVITKA